MPYKRCCAHPTGDLVSNSTIGHCHCSAYVCAFRLCSCHRGIWHWLQWQWPLSFINTSNTEGNNLNCFTFICFETFINGAVSMYICILYGYKNSTRINHVALIACVRCTCVNQYSIRQTLIIGLQFSKHLQTSNDFFFLFWQFAALKRNGVMVFVECH